jgi:hypothetical protein
MTKTKEPRQIPIGLHVLGRLSKALKRASTQPLNVLSQEHKKKAVNVLATKKEDCHESVISSISSVSPALQPIDFMWWAVQESNL